jgi:DNA-binding NtrC family response regulator
LPSCRCSHRWSIQLHAEFTVQSLENILIGVSPAICALREYLPKLAASPATVMIIGESGTGKERVAELLHRIGPRADGDFVAVNCAALPEALVESELFGHERGAFTGALSARKGHFRQADRGTLFLDEIGDMALGTQAKLLRALERHEVVPLGASRPVAVDVRVIAATNQPLPELVASQRFRTDLYYRLNVAPIQLPPLKARKQDIPLLFEHATRGLNRRYGRSVGAPDHDLLDCLMAHDWPGNVRELHNLVEAIFVDPPSGKVSLKNLPLVFRELFSAYQRTGADERRRMIAALEQTRWNKAEAAKQLNWSRMTLYRKLAKYELDRGSSA